MVVDTQCSLPGSKNHLHLMMLQYRLVQKNKCYERDNECNKGRKIFHSASLSVCKEVLGNQNECSTKHGKVDWAEEEALNAHYATSH